MKKILSISILLFLFACEDDKADEPVILDGTYKLSEASMGCDGATDIQYVTIDGLKVCRWDYDGDACDDGDDCYYKDSFIATKDGDALKIDFGDNEGSLVATRHGTNGLKVDFGGDGYEIWDYESSEVKTYSPICSND